MYCEEEQLKLIQSFKDVWFQSNFELFSEHDIYLPTILSKKENY